MKSEVAIRIGLLVGGVVIGMCGTYHKFTGNWIPRKTKPETETVEAEEA